MMSTQNSSDPSEYNAFLADIAHENHNQLRGKAGVACLSKTAGLHKRAISPFVDTQGKAARWVPYSPLRLWVPRDIFRHTGSSTRGAEGQEEPDYGRQIRPLKFRVKLLWRSVDIHNRSVYPWIALTLSIPAPLVQTFSGSKGSKITKTLSRHCM